MRVRIKLNRGLSINLGSNFKISTDFGVINPIYATKNQLLNGIEVTLSEYDASKIIITSIGTCTNFIEIPINKNPVTAYTTPSLYISPLCEMSLVLDLDMSTSTTNPPIDNSPIPKIVSKLYNPTIQSQIKREGKLYSAYFPGDNQWPSGSSGMYYFQTAPWNYLNKCFDIRTWVYLPSDKLTQHITSNFPGQWGGNILDNAICGHGGADTGGNVLAVYHPLNDFQNPKLRMYNLTAQYIESNINFPLDQWVYVRAVYDDILTKAFLYINDSLVAESTNISFKNLVNIGPKFFIGGRDDNTNTWFNWAWRGYISDFKMYT